MNSMLQPSKPESKLYLPAIQKNIKNFPDYLVGASGFVDYPWTKDLHVLLSHYDRYAEDPRFQEAARKGLRKVSR